MEDKRNIKQAMADSLKVLAVKMPFEKITIKQITDGAGVIRVTFYNHFQDKYDLLEWIVKNDIISPVRILLANNMYREALILMFTNMQKERKFYMHVVDTQGQNSFPEIVCRNFEELLLEMLPDGKVLKPKHAWLEPKEVAAYYAQSMSFVMIKWIRRGMPLDPEEMANAYDFLASHSLWGVMEELRRQVSSQDRHSN